MLYSLDHSTQKSYFWGNDSQPVWLLTMLLKEIQVVPNSNFSKLWSRVPLCQKNARIQKIKKSLSPWEMESRLTETDEI